MTLVAIRSVAFSSRYLSLDANGVTSFTRTGGGQAKTSNYVDSYETFILQKNDDGTVSFKSTFFNDVYIRLDGSNVPSGSWLAPGGGVVNGQFTAHSWERFHLRRRDKGWHQFKAVVAIESAAFPGRFLRMDWNPSVVNVQGLTQGWEEFELVVIVK